MKSKKFCTIYDHAVVSSPHGDEQSLTDQQYKNECDINRILKTYGATGKLPADIREGVSGDFSSLGDFQQCLEKINKAKNEFAALPSELRARFGNDPAAYVDFCLDPVNNEECIRLGLRVKPPKKERTSTEILENIEKTVTAKAEKPAS